MTTPPPNPKPAPSSAPGVPGPPTKHQLALMIWLRSSRPSPSSTLPSVTGSAP